MPKLFSFLFSFLLAIPASASFIFPGSQWKPPVANSAALPAAGNLNGDVRVALDTSSIYEWNGSAWVHCGGGGGSGTVSSVGLSAPASVFSVSGSPVTTTGTLALSFVNQNANTFFAGPTGGGAATPSFRALSSADLPGFPEGEVLFGTGTGIATNSLLFWNDSTDQLGVGVGEFVDTERSRIQGAPVTPVTDLPTDPVVTIVYGSGGYVTGGYTHSYSIYSYENIGGGTFYSATSLNTDPVTDNNQTVSPGDVSDVVATYVYDPSGIYTADGVTSHQFTVWGAATRSSGTAYSTNGGVSNSLTVDPTTVGDVENYNAEVNSGGTGYNDSDDYNFQIWAYTDSPVPVQVFSATPGSDSITGIGADYSVDMSWDAVPDALGYVIERYNVTTDTTDNLDVGNVTTYEDTNSGWNSGAPTTTPTEDQFPYNAEITWTPGANNDEYIVQNENDEYNTGIVDIPYTPTGWDNTGPFDNTPNSVQDDYYIDVSWTAPGTPPDGYLITVTDDYTPKDNDYYYTTTGTSIVDEDNADTPTPELTSQYYGTSLVAEGDILFSGKILGGDQFAASQLVIGEDSATLTTSNAVQIGFNNIGNLGVYNFVLGINTNVTQAAQRLFVAGLENTINTSASGGAEFSTIVGNANAATGTDGKYVNIFGLGNASSSRLVNIFGQSNTVTGSSAPRTTIIGVINSISGGSEHSAAIGYANSVSGSSQSYSIGYLNAVSTGIGNTAIGYNNTAGGGGGRSTALGYNNTSTENSFTAGYGCTASANPSFAAGYISQATAIKSMALGINAVSNATNRLAIAAINGSGEATDLHVQGFSTGSGAATQSILSLATAWSDSNNATRRGRVALGVYDTSIREAARMSTNGSAANFNLTSGTVATLSSLGSEKLTNGTFTGSATGWTLGTRWAYSSNTVVKNANGTGTLSQTSAGMATPLVPYQIYQLQYTVSSVTATSTITPSIAGVTLATVAVAGTYTEYFTALSTADLAFTPSNTSRFTIDNVSLKQVTAGDLSGANNLNAANVIRANEGFQVREGTNAAMGVATLSSGTVTVNTTKVTANSRIFLTVNEGTLTNVGFVYVSARSAGTSFTITSSNASDASSVVWEIKEPY